MEDRVVRAMRQLGFTATDARAYVGLLKNHPATGYELAARSGVPRSAVYNVLGRLEGLGLINAVQEKPAKYQPLPPDRLFELIESRFANDLDSLKASLRRLQLAPSEARTWTIQGYRGVLDQARGLIETSQHQVVASIWSREVERLAPALRQAQARGVELVLFSFTPLPPDLGHVHSYGIPPARLERYWSHRVILIVDHERALIGGADDNEENRAVVTEEGALMEMALNNLVLDLTLFGQRRGIDTGGVISKLTAHLAPVEALLEPVQAEA